MDLSFILHRPSQVDITLVSPRGTMYKNVRFPISDFFLNILVQSITHVEIPCYA